MPPITLPMLSRPFSTFLAQLFVRIRHKFLYLAFLYCFLGTPICYGSFNYTVLSGSQVMQANALSTMPFSAETVAYNPAGMMYLIPGKHMSFTGLLARFSLRWNGYFGGDGSLEEDYYGEEDRTYSYGNNTTVSHSGTQTFRKEATKPTILPGPLFQYANVGEKFGLGLSLKIPFVSPIAWDNHWVGRSLVQNIDLLVAGLNADVAYKVSPHHAFGLGLTSHSAHARYRRDGVILDAKNPNMVKDVSKFVKNLVTEITPLPFTLDFIEDTISNILRKALPTPIKIMDKIEFYGFSKGFSLTKNLSYMGNFNNLFYAINYITSQKVTIYGDLKMGLTPIASGLLYGIDAAMNASGLPPLKLTLVDQPAILNLKFPDHLDIALGYKDDEINPRLELEIGYAKEGFSIMDRMDVTLTKPSDAMTVVGFSADKVGFDLKFKDTHSYRAGGRYHLNEKYILKGGVEYTTAMTSKKYVSPLAGIGPLLEIGGGVEIKINDKESLGFGLGYIEMKPWETHESVQAGAFQEPINGTYSGDVTLLVITYNWIIDNECPAF
ncbi:outer membrane protein transport protein [Deltaproteobacteria bacterium TL4]